MKINPIQQQTANPSFNATLVRTTPIKIFIESMGQRDTAVKHKALWNKIDLAVKKHPSDAFIFTSINYLNDDEDRVKGVLSTSSYTYTNGKTKRSSYYAIFNTWKDILDPNNQNEFHNIFGRKYIPQYQEWWDKNIAPIWDTLSKIY